MNSNNWIRGFMLVEMLIVIAVLAALLSIAVPNYVAYTELARTAACLSNRYNIEQDKRSSYMNNEAQSLVIDNRYKCPSSGVYAWLVSDPTQPAFPRVGCSRHYASLPVAGNSVNDNFNDGNADGWFKSSNNWKVINGKYYGGVQGVRFGENRTFLEADLGANYTVQVDAKLISGSVSGGYGYGIYFGATDYANTLDSYIFQYDPGWQGGSFLFRKVVGGYESNPIATAPAPAGYQWNGVEKQITIAVSGNTYKAYISDINGGTTSVLQVTSPSFSGTAVGLRTWNDSYASFDNVTVTRQ